MPLEHVPVIELPLAVFVSVQLLIVVPLQPGGKVQELLDGVVQLPLEQV